MRNVLVLSVDTPDVDEDNFKSYRSQLQEGSTCKQLYINVYEEYSAYVRRIVADFSHAPPNEYSPSPDDKKQWSLNRMYWFGEADSQKHQPKKESKKAFPRHASSTGGK
ncbi:hypothetical protein Tco_0635295 [Tanacetum coccineum]